MGYGNHVRGINLYIQDVHQDFPSEININTFESHF